jgi:hypothetical protein
VVSAALAEQGSVAAQASEATLVATFLDFMLRKNAAREDKHVFIDM